MEQNKQLPLDLSDNEDRLFTAEALQQAAASEFSRDNPDIDKLKSIYRLTQLVLRMALGEAEQAVIKARKKAEEAARDTLTGIYDRSAIKEYVYPRLDKSEPDSNYFVLYCDVMDLGGVNQDFGHTQGDLLINSAADSLTISTGSHSDVGSQKKGVNNDYVVMRFGGDEFVIFGKGDEEAVNQLTENIQLNHSRILEKNTDLKPESYRGIKFGHAVLSENSKAGFELALDEADPKGDKK